MKIEKICLSCTSVFWVQPGVISAYCPSCGRRNYLNKWTQRHGSKTVHKSKIFDSREIEKMKIKEIAKKRVKARKRKILASQMLPKKEKKMTDIMKSFTDAAAAIQAVVDSVKKEGDAAKAGLVSLTKFMAEQKVIAAKNAKNVVNVLKDEVTQGMIGVNRDLQEFKTGTTKSVKALKKDANETNSFITDHLEKHSEFGAKMKETAAKAEKMAEPPIEQKVEAK